jgi:V-type H+-transporting ATPase subunit a
MTFPFLFGVMFGDVGHGGMLILFALYLCFDGKRIRASGGMLAEALRARYLLLLMGICAMYNGFIYNDFLSIPFDFFGSKWDSHSSNEYNNSDFEDQVVNTGVYPFGLDPKWYHADNRLVFFNSFKMKTAVVFGVI